MMVDVVLQCRDETELRAEFRKLSLARNCVTDEVTEVIVEPAEYDIYDRTLAKRAVTTEAFTEQRGTMFEITAGNRADISGPYKHKTKDAVLDRGGNIVAPAEFAAGSFYIMRMGLDDFTELMKSATGDMVGMMKIVQATGLPEDYPGAVDGVWGDASHVPQRVFA